MPLRERSPRRPDRPAAAPPSAGGPFAGEAPTVIRELPDGAGRWCLDTTTAELDGTATVLDLRGWVALAGSPDGVVAPHLVTPGGRRPIAPLERADVREAHPDMTVLGFEEVVDLALLAGSRGVIAVGTDKRTFELALPPVARLDERSARYTARKEALLARLRPLLACPLGHGALEDQRPGALVCPTCGYRGRRTPRSYELVPDGRTPPVPRPPFSAHRYDDEPREQIAASDGLVLDFGSGLRYESFDNVVNLDLSPFPTTDVVANCHALPFADGGFDGVISVAVFEHLADPRRAVSEIARVVRAGGSIYVAVPFLQPYHGWPGHYFNMTREGLALLFADEFVIDDIVTPPRGTPINALTWIIDWYLRGLPEPVRTEFAKRRIGEFAGAVDPHLDKDYVTALDPSAVAELACVNVLYARRRVR